MRIRPAEPDDLADLVAIYNHAVEHTVATFDVQPFAVADRQAWFAQFDDDNPLLVAVGGDHVLGYAYYLPYRSRPAYAATRETTVYIAPDSRSQGAGTALYEALIRIARERGVHTLVAVIGGDNPASEALHRRLGFRLVGRLREVGWKHGGWVDTSLFQLLLAPA